MRWLVVFGEIKWQLILSDQVLKGSVCRGIWARSLDKEIPEGGESHPVNIFQIDFNPVLLKCGASWQCKCDIESIETGDCLICEHAEAIDWVKDRYLVLQGNLAISWQCVVVLNVLRQGEGLRRRFSNDEGHIRVGWYRDLLAGSSHVDQILCSGEKGFRDCKQRARRWGWQRVVIDIVWVRVD